MLQKSMTDDDDNTIEDMHTYKPKRIFSKISKELLNGEWATQTYS